MATTLGPHDLLDPIRAHVSLDFTTVRSDLTVGDALESLRRGKLAEKIVYFYVTDAADRLVGVLPTRRLLMSAPDVPIAKIMVAHVLTLPDTATVADACEMFILHKLLALPVVDREKKLLGVVNVHLFTDEVFDMAERRTVDDVFQVIGVRIAQGRRPGPLAGFRSRFPWLLCNIAGGTACAVLTGHYEELLGSVIVLALFVPVVLALAESVSMQAMTITVHSLHEGEVTVRSLLATLGRELVTALLLAVGCGGVVALIAWVWKRSPSVSLVVGASIALSVVTACVLGVLIPTVVRKFKGDPKIAAGPIVLATADLATLLFYFNLSRMVLIGT
ncbi:MAG: magnesium transporter [Planctomycetota bacterium]